MKQLLACFQVGVFNPLFLFGWVLLVHEIGILWSNATILLVLPIPSANARHNPYWVLDPDSVFFHPSNSEFFSFFFFCDEGNVEPL